MCGRYGLAGADVEDVSGEVWLLLVANLHTIRDPKALLGWLTTTTRNECLMLLRHKKRQLPSDHEIAAETEPQEEAEACLLAQNAATPCATLWHGSPNGNRNCCRCCSPTRPHPTRR